MVAVVVAEAAWRGRGVGKVGGRWEGGGGREVSH